MTPAQFHEAMANGLTPEQIEAQELEDEAFAAVEREQEARAAQSRLGRPSVIDAAGQALVKAHAAAGGTWKTLRSLEVKPTTYYNILAGRGKYGANHEIQM